MKSNAKSRMGHNIHQKEKKLVTKQYDKKKTGHNKPLLCCKFPSIETQCQSNEGFSEISYMRMIYNLLPKCQKKGWKFPTSFQTCLFSPSL